MTAQLLPDGMPIIKRVMDLILTISGLIVISPLLLLISFLILITYGHPILFRQQRPGLRGKIFTIFKFRTMSEDVDVQGKLLSDGQRLLPVGKILRAFSMDELPELFNVVRGEMSLVGPRPLLIEYLDRYTSEQARRHEVVPGITGWAQVNGRNQLTWEEKFILDVWYVDHWSFWLDIRILFITLWKVLKREGISQPGMPTTQYFLGSDIDKNE